MSSKAIDEAFRRHARPQPALLSEFPKAPEKPKPPKKTSKDLQIYQKDPWCDGSLLGDLIQGKRRWSIGFHQGKLIMLKKINPETGKQLIEKIKPLSHPNVSKLIGLFEHDHYLHMMFEDSRFTLEEVLSVHLRLDEPHIRVIACSVYSAIKHMAVTGIIHNAISPATIRIQKSGKVVLADFDDCILQTANLSPNVDLKLLGFTILECMDGSTNRKLRNAEFVQSQRDMNKIFGLRDGERWSGFNILIDFLDELFNGDKPAIAKLDRPQEVQSEMLVPFVELVPLECFTVWHAAAKEKPIAS